MELDRYLRALVQRWYVVALLLGVGIIGTWVYFRFTGGTTATAIVAVMEPTAAKGTTGGEQAQVNFASIAQSRAVADRVIQKLRLGIDSQQLTSNISVKLAPTLVPSATMPLYSVQVKDRDPGQALRLADTVVAEARALFLELNTLDPNQIDASLQQREDQVRQQAEQARSDLLNFQQQNHAFALETQIQAQTGLVTGLRQAVTQNSFGQLDAAVSHADVSEASSTVDAELSRLESLRPQYDRLTFEVNLAAGEVSQLSSRASDLSVADATAVAPAVKAVQAQLDGARARLTTARANLAAFQRDNGVGDLNSDISNRVALLGDLRRQELLTASLPPNTEALVAPERQELDRLMALEPEYQRLAARVGAADGFLATLEARKFDLIVSSALPPDAQVKVLDSAYIQPDTLFTIILYTLGAVLGLSFGLGAVYLIGYFDRTPYDLTDVQALYPTQLLIVRLPPAH
jgi:hypothetical protein